MISRDDLSAVLDMITDKVLDQQSKEKIIDGVCRTNNTVISVQTVNTQAYVTETIITPDIVFSYYFWLLFCIGSTLYIACGKTLHYLQITWLYRFLQKYTKMGAVMD